MLKDDHEGLPAVARSYNDVARRRLGVRPRRSHPDRAAPPARRPRRSAEAELRRVIERGARLVVMRPAPVASVAGPRSLGDPAHDRVWALAAEAGVVVAFHAADDGYTYAGDWGENARYTGLKQSAFSEVLSIHSERPIFDTMAAMVCHGVYDRHPTLKVATVELGAGWVPWLVRRFRVALRQAAAELLARPGRDRSASTSGSRRSTRTTSWSSPTCIGIEHVLLGLRLAAPRGHRPTDRLPRRRRRLLARGSTPHPARESARVGRAIALGGGSVAVRVHGAQRCRARAAGRRPRVPRRRRCRAARSNPGWAWPGARTLAFSQALAARGWVGMSLPRDYGGGDRSVGRTLRRGRGAAAMGRAARAPLGRRPPERAAARQGGNARAEGAVPSRHLPGRAVVLHRDERARLGQRPRVGDDARRRVPTAVGS